MPSRCRASGVGGARDHRQTAFRNPPVNASGRESDRNETIVAIIALGAASAFAVEAVAGWDDEFPD